MNSPPQNNVFVTPKPILVALLPSFAHMHRLVRCFGHPTCMSPAGIKYGDALCLLSDSPGINECPFLAYLVPCFHSVVFGGDSSILNAHRGLKCCLGLLSARRLCFPHTENTQKINSVEACSKVLLAKTPT